jgi:hypothetical protein
VSLPTDILSAAELRELTASNSARKQMAWLAERGVPFRFDGARVRVLRVVAAECEVLAGRASQGPRLDLVR